MLKTCSMTFLTAILVVAVSSFAKPPATQPSSEIERSFTELTNDDPNIRDLARIHLMGLSRADLEKFREVVEKSRPLAPSQSAALHDIVVHAFLAGEPYEKNLGIGFLGVTLGDLHQPAVVAADEDGQAPPTQGVDGVMIMRCVPGFCAFRFLQANDVVLGVLGQDLIATPGRNDLREKVQETLPGDTITLQVLRQGKVIRLSFKVDGQPREAEVPGMDIDTFVNPRLIRAEEYWQQKFAPLLAPVTS